MKALEGCKEFADVGHVEPDPIVAHKKRGGPIALGDPEFDPSFVMKLLAVHAAGKFTFEVSQIEP